jgi:hypothetical protein
MPKFQDSSAPQYRWPVWTPTNKAGSIKTNFNFGSYISSVTSRDSLASVGEKPVYISPEDILSTYSDFNSRANNNFKLRWVIPWVLTFKSQYILGISEDIAI